MKQGLDASYVVERAFQQLVTLAFLAFILALVLTSRFATSPIAPQAKASLLMSSLTRAPDDMPPSHQEDLTTAAFLELAHK